MYTEAHIFINPSVEETFSMVTVEAMACGTPVIVLDTSAVCELISENSGYVVHKSSNASCSGTSFMNAIIDVENKINNNSITSDNAIKNASKYGVKNQTDRIIDLYKYITSK